MKKLLEILCFDRMAKQDYTSEERRTLILAALMLVGILVASAIEAL